MDKISSVASPPEKSSYDKICKKFGVKPNQMRRPMSIDLLISMRQNFLHPEPVKTINRLILYDGPLGKVFGGQDKDLEFSPHVACVPKSVHLCTTWQGAQSEITKNRVLDEGPENQLSKFLKKSQVSVTNLAEKKTVNIYNPINKESNLARWAGRASMITKEEKDWNINTSENEDVIAESLPPSTVSRSKEKSVRPTLWVCITMLFLSLIGLYLVHQYIQAIHEVSDLQTKVMRKAVNTPNIINNRIDQIEVENLTSERPIGIKHFENFSINYLSSKCLLLENSELMWLNLKLCYLSLLVRHKWHTDKGNVEVGDICFLKAVKLLRGECEAMKNEKENASNVEGLANLGRVILDLAILQGDERDLLLQPQVDDAQGGDRDS